MIESLGFVFERLNWLSILDLAIVMLVFFGLLILLRDTQAVVLLRGVLLLVVLGSLLNSTEVLPAFSWLVRTTLPALVLAIPVIFAPEIRRALERLGRAGSIFGTGKASPGTQKSIAAVVNAAIRLSDRRHGALIVMQRLDNLEEFVRTGVIVDAQVTPELILQIFYPNTPLHDGAVILDGSRMLAAACVMPLSASGVLAHTPDRQLGLRHRAALGISEVSDAVVVIVSEESGTISVVSNGRMIRRLDADRLENILRAFFNPNTQRQGLADVFKGIYPGGKKPGGEN
ncbi:MAG: TIGR00159 family protein [Chloroflexi bacterium RBG_19FT_COMBO_49_13]|nr:MAG: TIGR00159 family protein [Chloroflexi bacterium RBG_19FT_COMBO_49_13]